MNIRQAMQLLSVLQNNADWEAVDAGVAQNIIDSPQDAGEQFTSFLKNRGRMSLIVSSASSEVQLAEWLSLYAELGITLNPEGMKIPERKSGIDRLIVVPKGMTAQKAFDLCTRRFNTWKYTNISLDTAVPKNDRTADKSAYVLWIRDRVEADEELKSKSATDLVAESIKGITLTERLLLEIKFHKETGKHLDLKNWTLCSGSRGSGGSVPYVYWDDGRLWVCWYYAYDQCSNLRSRAVSL